MNKHRFACRAATNEDTDKIIDLVKSILTEFHFNFDSESSEKDLLDIEKIYINTGGTFIVIENSRNDIIGTIALLRLDSKNCKLRKMYVDRNFRGLGLGDRLMTQALAKATELNFKTVYLETVHSMKAAISLYRKYGFEILSTKITSSPRCDIVMMKNL